MGWNHQLETYFMGFPVGLFFFSGVCNYPFLGFVFSGDFLPFLPWDSSPSKNSHLGEYVCYIFRSHRSEANPSKTYQKSYEPLRILSRWWFQIFFIFTPTWGNDPIWLIFFRWASNRCNPPTPQRGVGISHKRQSGCDVGAQLEGARGARRGASLTKFGKGNPLFDRGVLQTNTFFTGFSWVFYKQFPFFGGGDFSMLKWIQWWTKNTMNIHPLVDLSQMQVYTHHTSSVWVLGGSSQDSCG